ncbi:hypothetical protein [Prosthecobacter vanneervenii]|uniref:Uncharacterized protein n=1 Tax=Prosthecobacter vanneervenii TaxID=48466 RepID=A0A7W7YC57_9BACT|nr:hypothetical protein [Prosthecobacter vanneervenii]MBB5033150.1 hypothetical protein [Prosthecobacter vanneervenii]
MSRLKSIDPEITVDQLNELRRELFNSHPVRLALAASIIAKIASSDVVVSFWAPSLVCTDRDHRVLSTAFTLMINEGWQFQCLTPAAPTRPASTIPTLRAA